MEFVTGFMLGMAMLVVLILGMALIIAVFEYSFREVKMTKVIVFTILFIGMMVTANYLVEGVYYRVNNPCLIEEK